MKNLDDRIKAQLARIELGPEHLHPYQRDQAIPFLRKNPFSALFIDMGMGKTVCCLTVICDILRDLEDDDLTLVIGPMRVATSTWPDEIRQWRHTAPFTFSLIHISDDDPRLKGFSGPAKTIEKERLRKIAARSRAPIHIVPANWVEWLVDFWGPKWPYRRVFVDESSMFKDHNSVRFTALARVRNSELNLITRLHILTATPAAETYEHLFAQIYLLDKGERFGKYITNFRKKYFNENKYKRKWEIRPGGEEEVLAKIADISLVLKAEDYLKLDKPNIVPRYLNLNEKSMALYREMEEEFIVTLPSGVEIEAETAAALSQKLLQMASGVLYEEIRTSNGDKVKKTRVVHELHDDKLDELRAIVDDLALKGESVLVAYHHNSSRDRIHKAFPKSVIMDAEAKCKAAWNSRKIKMLLMHPASGGHGLNLQKGGHHIVFFDIPWSLELYLQLIGRLARQGQTKVVMVYLLIARGTIDEYVAKMIQAKRDAQDKLFSMLKRRIKKYREKKQLEAYEKFLEAEAEEEL